MRYSLEPSYRKYVQGQGFKSFAKIIGNEYGRKIFNKSIDVSNKYGRKILDKSMDAGKDLAKIAGKNVLHKSAEATGEMIGNKVTDRITKILEIKNKKKMIE